MIFGKGVVGLFREEGRKKTDSAGDEYLSISTFVDILPQMRCRGAALWVLLKESAAATYQTELIVLTFVGCY